MNNINEDSKYGGTSNNSVVRANQEDSSLKVGPKKIIDFANMAKPKGNTEAKRSQR